MKTAASDITFAKVIRSRTRAIRGLPDRSGQRDYTAAAHTWGDLRLAKAIFWAALGLLIHTHAGYPVALRLLARRSGDGGDGGNGRGGGLRPLRPRVSLVIAAHDEEEVIERKVANALALDYPRELLEIVVASDGSADATVERARAAGADVVLDLPRAGKIATQNAAVERSRGEIVAFSDANAYWEPAALARLVDRFADPEVGYVCGQVRFLDAEGTNEEGAYWRLEMMIREDESALAGVTAGNGAIYAVRREAYVPLGPSRSHDLSFPFALTKAGWRCLYEPGAVAEEKLVPSLEGEFQRKRRMMRGLWDIVVRDGMVSPRGYPALYGFEIASHRLLRYASPFLHLLAFAANLRLLGAGRIYRLALAAQLAVLVAAASADGVPSRLAGICRYYVYVTASIAAGLWDRWRDGPPAAWEKSEGTR
jgi:cellulose synthase/poly-beta-1,6-N-acetylglucosamine synthase-like glycosyltransferase